LTGDRKSARLHAVKAQNLGEEVQKELLQN
jgi:hypothetical protein